jgi:hypothetical protein
MLDRLYGTADTYMKALPTSRVGNYYAPMTSQHFRQRSRRLHLSFAHSIGSAISCLMASVPINTA